MLLFALAASLAAQDEPVRQRMFGVASKLDGTPWVGARVVLREVCEPEVWLDDADELSAMCDARGRFHADLLAGRTYAAWAQEALDGGAARCSAIVRGVRTGLRIELRATAVARRACTLVLEGIPSTARRPLVARLDESVLSRRTRLVVEDDGELVIPPHPTTDARLSVVDADGKPVILAALGVSDADRRLVLPGATLRRLLVLDEEKVPIADATLHLLEHGELLPLTRTDADGRATIDLAFAMPITADSPPSTALNLVVRAAGKQIGRAVTRTAGAVGIPPVPDVADVFCRCDDESSSPNLAQRLELLADGVPLPGVSVVVGFTARHVGDGDSEWDSTGLTMLRSDNQGEVDLRGLRIGHEVLWLRVSSSVLARLPAAWRQRMPGFVPLFPPAVLDHERSATVDLVRDLRPVELALLRHDDGSPAAGASCHIDYQQTTQLGAVSDNAGLARLLVQVRGLARARIGVLGEAGWAALEFDAIALRKQGAEPVRLAVPLRRVAALRVSPLTPNEFPPPTGTWGSLTINDYEPDPTGIPAVPVAPVDGVRFALSLDGRTALETVLWAGRRFPMGVADQLCHVPAVNCDLSISVTGRCGTHLALGVTRIRLAGNESEVPVEVPLRVF